MSTAPSSIRIMTANDHLSCVRVLAGDPHSGSKVWEEDRQIGKPGENRGKTILRTIGPAERYCTNLKTVRKQLIINYIGGGEGSRTIQCVDST
jgi:hypothetical protein